MKHIPQLVSIILASYALVGIASAQPVSTTPGGLPNYDDGGVPTARINTLTVTLDPASGPIHGLRGTTVGWGFKVEWASNAGDKLAFTGSRLVGETSAFTTGYKDYIGKLSGKTNGVIAAGETWERAFVENKGGLGAVPILPTAKPGSGYVGQVLLTFNVYDSRGPDLGETLGSFEMLLNVSVLVDSEDPVDQSITFDTISNTTFGSAPFTITATASSGLPVTLTSLNPEVCTVSGNTVTVVSAGTCTILAAQDGDTQYNAAPSVTQTFEVAKATASVAINGSLTQNYNGSPKSLSGQPTPGGLNVAILYSGDPTPPTEPGLYYVQALINESNYEGAAAAGFLIVDTRPPQLTTFSNWLTSKFNPGDLNNPLVVGGSANPDSDAFPNSFEYAMGFNPIYPSSPKEQDALPRLSVTPVDWTLYFSIPEQAASDVTFLIETSSDLTSGNWQEITRRAGNGAWTGTANVFVGTAKDSRVPILVTQPSLPYLQKRFYRMRAVVE